MEPKLESLLMSKTFEELDAEERIFVLASLTEDSYHAYHLMLKHVIESADEDTLVPSAAIPAKLKAHFEATRKPAVWAGISLKQLSIAACLLLAVSLGVVFFKSDRSAKPQLTLGQAKIDLPKELKKSSINISKSAVSQKVEDSVKVVPEPRIMASLKPAYSRKPKPAIKAVSLPEKRDTVTLSTDKFYGLHVQDPLLGLNIDVNDQLLGLRIPVVNL